MKLSANIPGMLVCDLHGVKVSLEKDCMAKEKVSGKKHKILSGPSYLMIL